LERGLFRIAIVALAVTVVLLAQRELSRGETESAVLGVQTEAGVLVAGAEGQPAQAAGAVAESVERFSVIEPRSGVIVSSWKIDVVGVGPADTAVSSGATSVAVDRDGTWVMPVILFRGENHLDFQNGSTGATIAMTVTYDPDADLETEDVPEEAEPSPTTTVGNTTASRASSGAELAAAPAPTTTAKAAPTTTAKQKAATAAAARKANQAKASNDKQTSPTTRVGSSDNDRVAVSRTPVASETPTTTTRPAAKAKAAKPNAAKAKAAKANAAKATATKSTDNTKSSQNGETTTRTGSPR